MLSLITEISALNTLNIHIDAKNCVFQGCKVPARMYIKYIKVPAADLCSVIVQPNKLMPGRFPLWLSHPVISSNLDEDMVDRGTSIQV